MTEQSELDKWFEMLPFRTLGSKWEKEAKQALTELFKKQMLDIIGEDDNATGSGGGVYAVRIKGRNTLRAELRAKVRELK